MREFAMAGIHKFCDLTCIFVERRFVILEEKYDEAFYNRCFDGGGLFRFFGM
jgi:hypothetical protein